MHIKHTEFTPYFTYKHDKNSLTEILKILLSLRRQYWLLYFSCYNSKSIPLPYTTFKLAACQRHYVIMNLYKANYKREHFCPDLST